MEEQPKRIVDTQTFLPVLIDLVREGHTVALTITGHSMTPFLVHGRDQIRFCRPDHPLKRGDMAFFRRRNGAYVMHRICRVDREGRYYLVGDEQTVIEMRYLDGAKWWAISAALYGSEDDYDEHEKRYLKRTFKVHGSALQSLARIDKAQTPAEE